MSKTSPLRNRIFGGIGMGWGSAILLSKLFRSAPAEGQNAAFAAGQTAGLVMGGLLVAVGLYYFINAKTAK